VVYHFQLQNQLSQVADTVSSACKACEAISWLDPDNLALCLTEALNNAVVHGCPSEEDVTINLTLEIAGDTCEFLITDRFQMLEPAHLKIEQQAPEEQFSGRGLYLIQCLAAEVVVSDGHLLILFQKSRQSQ